MIRQLAQCPYCQGCEVALTDSPELVFNPGGTGGPCPHLVWLEGRYSQWELTILPGRKTRLPRLIGSTELGWAHPALGEGEEGERAWTFLRELAGAGTGWDFAPPIAHVVQPISLDQTVKGPDGKDHPSWEVEGAVIFAQDAPAFVAAIPACLERQGSVWPEPPSFPSLG